VAMVIEKLVQDCVSKDLPKGDTRNSFLLRWMRLKLLIAPSHIRFVIANFLYR